MKQTVSHEGKTLMLAQQPYLDGTHEHPIYRAAAEDAEGNLYRVMWQIVAPDAEDESEACDWGRYEVSRG